MRDFWIHSLLLLICAAAGYIGGHYDGKHAADRWYAQHTLKLEGITDNGLGTTATRALSSSPSNYLADGLFCSQDGVNWWRARNDGSCWASDKPSVTLIPPIKLRVPAPVASVEEPR